MPFRQRVKAQDEKIFMQQADCSIAEKGLWQLLKTFADADGTNCFPSQKKLAAQAQMSVDWVKDHIKNLQRLGYLEIKKERVGKYFRNVYTLRSRGLPSHPGGVPRSHPTKSLIPGKTLAVESEAILHLLPDPQKKKSSTG